MNRNQRSTTLNSLEKLKTKYNSQLFSNENERQLLSGRRLPSDGLLNKDEIDKYLSHILKRLEEELLNNWKLLPFEYLFTSGENMDNIDADINSLNEYIYGGDKIYNSQRIIDQTIKRIILYMKMNGIWDEPAVDISLANTLLKASENFKRRFEININEFSDVFKQAKVETERINSMMLETEKKSHNFNEFTYNIHKKSEELNEEVFKVKATSSKLMQTLEDSLDKVNDIETLVKKVSTENENLNEELKTLRLNNEEMRNSLIDMDLKKIQFDARNKELDELIGKEVATNLSHTFATRKSEIKKMVTVWTWLVFLSSIITVVWIYFVFEKSTATSSNEIVVLTINSIKTVPALFLLYFAIFQYNKERNLLEQYAFKSAVALTIDAYAGKLDSDEKMKREMIINSIDKVYNTPMGSSKYDKFTSGKDILNVANNVLDTAKELVKK